MAQEFEDKVIPLSQANQNRKKEISLGELDEATFRKILEEVVDSSVSSNISHLESKISRLETSMNRIADQFEAIRNGEVEEAALRVTTDQSNTDLALANIKIHPEEYYRYTCSEIAEKLNVQNHDVTKMIKMFELRGNSIFHLKIRTGKKNHISKWSDQAYLKLKTAVDSKAYIPNSKKK